MDVRAYWLWLVLVFGPADVRIWQLSKNYNSVQDFAEAVMSGAVVKEDRTVRERSKKYTLENAAEIIDNSELSGISVYCYESEGYPDRLKEIPNPPAVIFVKGSLDFLANDLLITVAGTRDPSDYSKRITEVVCRELSEKGCIIVSGMSEGTDTLANKVAIGCESKTLGICGNAIDLYDERNDEFISSVVAHGALISETCSAMEVQRPKFSNRNRILTAMSDAVIFIEGSLTSRGLDICERAIAHGRFLFVVPPHDITESRYQGQSWLLRRGCKPLLSVQDVLYTIAHLNLDMLNYNADEDYSEIEDYSFFVDESPVTERKSDKSRAKKVTRTAEDDNYSAEKPEVDYSELDDLERSICELIAAKPLLADSIAQQLDTDISVILSKLTMLELDGYITSLPGKQFGLI